MDVEEVWYTMSDGRGWSFYCPLDTYKEGNVLYAGKDAIYWMKLGLIHVFDFTDKTLVYQRIIKSKK